MTTSTTPLPLYITVTYEQNRRIGQTGSSDLTMKLSELLPTKGKAALVISPDGDVNNPLYRLVNPGTTTILEAYTLSSALGDSPLVNGFTSIHLKLSPEPEPFFPETAAGMVGWIPRAAEPMPPLLRFSA